MIEFWEPRFRDVGVLTVLAPKLSDGRSVFVLKVLQNEKRPNDTFKVHGSDSEGKIGEAVFTRAELDAAERVSFRQDVGMRSDDIIAVDKALASISFEDFARIWRETGHRPNDDEYMWRSAWPWFEDQPMSFVRRFDYGDDKRFNKALLAEAVARVRGPGR